MVYYKQIMVVPGKRYEVELKAAPNDVNLNFGMWQQGFFNPTLRWIRLPATKIEYDTQYQERADKWRGGPIRQILEEIPCIGRIDNPNSVVVTRYWYKPNRHQKRHAAAWRLADSLK